MVTLTLPIPVKSALRKLGGDIRDARLRRRIPSAVMAQRAFISRTTLVKVEKGDPGVGLGTYAAVLFALGMLDRLEVFGSSVVKFGAYGPFEYHDWKTLRRATREECRRWFPGIGCNQDDD